MADSDRCCCNLLHVKTGTWIILIIQFVFAVIGCVQALLAFFAGEHQRMSSEGRWAFIIQLISLILWTVLIVIAMVALLKNRARLLFPHLVASVVMVIVFIVQGVLVVIGGTALANIAFFILMVAFILLCLYVEYQCWKYLSAFSI